MAKKLKNLSIAIVSASTLLLCFNNCADGLKLQEQTALSSTLGDGNPTTPDPIPNTPNPPVVPPATGNMPPDFSANSLKVCASGCEYTLPSQAAKMVKDGETIEIKSGDYIDCMSIRANNVTVRGVGTTRPHLHSKLCDGKGIITNYGSKNRFENFEISDFSNSDYNGAGVRQDVLAKDVILSNIYFHHGQMGIMGGSTGDRIRGDRLEFKNVGYLRPDGEISLPIFMTAGNSLEIRASSFMESVGGASFIKTRALETLVDCSTLANLETPDSYTIDYQTGGKLSILNSVLEQSQKTVNSTMVGINSVSYNANITNSLMLKGNIFLNDAGRGNMVNLFRQAPSTISVTDNVFIGGGNIFNNGYTVDSSNMILATRPATIGPYPNLPAPGNCLTAVPSF